jgi:hypothetical protein
MNISGTIILPVVLYGCKILLLILREEQRLRVLEYRVLRRIFRPKRDEVTGQWKRQHREKLYDMFSSPYIIQMIETIRMRRWGM